MTRIGIVSLAHGHAFSYLNALLATEGVEVRVADPDATPGEAGRGAPAIEGTGAGWSDSLDDLLAWQPDGVIVCSENVRHRTYTEAALAAGAHVLCEKPMATSVADAAAMVRAADAAGRRLMIAHPVRHSTAFTSLRAAIERGDLGDLLAVTGTNNGKVPGDRPWFTDPALAGGGAVTDHTVHVLDLLDALLHGDAPVSVNARANRLLHPEMAVETAGLVQIRYAGGVLVTIDCSWSRPADYPTWGGLTLDVVGADGLARMDAFGTRVGGHIAGRGQAWLPYGDDMDAALIAEFLQVVRTGEEPHPDGRAGLRGTAIVHAAYTSIRTGEVVTIDPAALSPGA